ncbi:MAG: hypothetical protein FWF75_10250, partial [Propionibacteriaceae bacterium]|nr:hypothetical protein [Propionibacteriaceae bacterium]
AILDLHNASMGLPLDAYTMTSGQKGVVQAAQQIVFAQCILGTNQVPTATIESATSILHAAPSPDRWVYGYWDATYIAANGLGSPWSSYSLGEGLTFTDQQGSDCAHTDKYLNLNVIDANSLSFDNNQDVQLLTSIGLAANSQTMGDSRFKELVKSRTACIENKGYSINSDSGFGSLAIPDDWSTEQKLKAAITQAQCSDEANFMQQAGDITATYQQIAIDAHQAELASTQSLIRDRLAEAKTVLQEVGLM